MSSNNELEGLKDLTKVLNDGVEFYNEASEKLSSSPYRPVFQRMAAIREGAITRLQPYIVVRDGEMEDGHTVGSTLRRHYTSLLANIKSDPDHTYISQLEETEDKTLDTLEDALQKAKSPAVQSTLLDLQTSMKRCHDEMLSLQKASS